MNTETHQFQAEVRQLLDIVINALYSDREIFVRELVSNASDALEKLRLKQLTDSNIYQPDKPLEITVTTDKENKTITIADTGIGMSEVQLGQIFQAFEQADSSTTRRFGGSGLGLAICRQLAQLMHGQLEVVSQPGAGSTFSLVWQAPVATPPAVTPAGPVAPDGMPAGLRVLLAEDNPVNQRLALKMLEKLGIRAVLAANGRQAVIEARRMQPDLILMDLQMPECDGLDATRAIRRLEQPQPVIVALTANALAEDREACLAAGMDDHLAKPFTLAELRHMLASQQDRLRARSRAVLPAGPSCPV